MWQGLTLYGFYSFIIVVVKQSHRKAAIPRLQDFLRSGGMLGGYGKRSFPKLYSGYLSSLSADDEGASKG